MKFWPTTRYLRLLHGNRYLYGDVAPRLWGSELCAILRTNGSLCSSPEVLWNDEPLASLSNCPSTKAPMTEPPLN